MLAVMQDSAGFCFLMIPAVLGVACLGGYWLSSRALRPGGRDPSVARSIGVQNLAQRVAVPQTGDELQRMSETWNEVLERLEISVKRIRQFTADASTSCARRWPRSAPPPSWPCGATANRRHTGIRCAPSRWKPNT